MSVLVFEWLTGGGLWLDEDLPDPKSSIQSQGNQMLAAIVEDFLAGNGTLILPVDIRLADSIPDHPRLTKIPITGECDLPRRLEELSGTADHVMLIAPETDSCLLKVLSWIGSHSKKLISSREEFVRIASCKQTTFEFLESQGFHAFPRGLNFSEFDQFKLEGDDQAWIQSPVVFKPIDGAGSEEVEYIEDLGSWRPQMKHATDQYRLEEFIVGVPVSVSVLCDGKEFHPLQPTIQQFDKQPFGNYVGASTFVEPSIAVRAISLAQQVIEKMPSTRGYVGMDMVIADSGQSRDCLIEVNPRLTMSYLTLRDIYSENLAVRMLPGNLSGSSLL